MMRVGQWMMNLAAAVYATSTAVAGDVVSESAAIAQIRQLGGVIHDGTPMGLTVNLEPIPFLVIPFWAIVIPLTLLSAYLLLSKPKSVPLRSESV